MGGWEHGMDGEGRMGAVGAVGAVAWQEWYGRAKMREEAIITHTSLCETGKGPFPY